MAGLAARARCLHQGRRNRVLKLDSSVAKFATKKAYDPYGAQATATALNGTLPPNPWRYAGGYLDPTGLYHFGARYYEPTSGRWTQQDSVVSLGNPADGNRYAYVGDDPVNYLDLLGSKKSTTDYINACGAGAAGGLAVGLVGGEDFTGVGAIVAAGEGCAYGLYGTKLTDVFGEAFGKAYDYSSRIKDDYDITKHFFEKGAAVMTSRKALGWLAVEFTIFLVASTLLSHGQGVLGSVLLLIGAGGLVSFSILRRLPVEESGERKRSAPTSRQTQQALIYAGMGITYYALGRMTFFHDHLVRELLLTVAGVVVIVFIWRKYQR